MRALLISTYDLGRQPFGLASPAAWLRRAGVDVRCVDTSREPLVDADALAADLIAFYLPMHTATRLTEPLLDRVRVLNPQATLAAYGLYAPLNAEWLREHGVAHVIGPEAEEELVTIATGGPEGPPLHQGYVGADLQVGPRVARLAFITPDREGLPALANYAALQMPNGSRRVVGSTDATRGCKHVCRHCPIVPVYGGTFRVVPVDVVMADIRAQVAAGAQHISFGDPDFFNGPTHAQRIVERLAREHPGVTYDVTIKIEHLLMHAPLLPLLRETGCLFVTSAVESVDDEVLARLRKGHTRADFVRAVALCRAERIALSPTFVPFTPWTTLSGYVDLIATLETLELIEDVAPIQLAIRLLVTSNSALLELSELRDAIGEFDRASLTYPWRHSDARLDALQRDVMQLVGARAGDERAIVFAEIAALARERAGIRATPSPRSASHKAAYMTEAWYCCAEPGPELVQGM